MRNALLVARREFTENVQTKGFWLGVITTPLLLLLAVNAQRWLDASTPTRAFVVVDPAGLYIDAIDAAVDRLHQQEVLKAFGTYLARHALRKEPPTAADLESTPAVDVDSLLKRYSDANPAAVDMFVSQGGVAMALGLVRSQLKPDAPPFEEPRRPYVRVKLPAEVDPHDSAEVVAEALRPWLRGERQVADDERNVDLFAAVVVPPAVIDHVIRPGSLPTQPTPEASVQFWAANLADTDLAAVIEQAINDHQRREEFRARDVDATTVRAVQSTSVPLVKLNPTKASGREQVSMADQIRQWAPTGFVYLLWISIFAIASMLLNNTIEEKSNRLVEVLFSSITPWELMTGKLTGIAAAGLSMVGSWLVALVAVLWWQAGPQAEFAQSLLEVVVGSGLLPAFLGYFLLGYLLYGGLFLALGSVCNTLKEAQNMMQPVMLVMIVPLLTMVFIPKDPNGTLARVMSWIPIYTPFVMMNRAAASPPAIDLYGTTLLLLASVVFTLWLAGRIFAVGILRTGQPPRLVELLRWISRVDATGG
jgi:ABC-2 type transport system permease protein